jgi:hypothetical protein
MSGMKQSHSSIAQEQLLAIDLNVAYAGRLYFAIDLILIGAYPLTHSLKNIKIFLLPPT